MKKALIAIISAIYVVAIIIVSFLGAKSEISNRVVYAQEIVLLNEDVFRENLPKIENNIIIDVYKRPEESEINPETGVGPSTSTSGVKTPNINWNYNWDEEKGAFQSQRDYAIFITDFNFLYDQMGKMLQVKTSIKPDNTTKKDLSYKLSGADKVLESVTINNNGAITFKKNWSSSAFTDFDVFVETQDLSGVEIDVLIKVRKYEL